MDQRKLDQIEYKAKETLRARLSQITYKTELWNKLYPLLVEFAGYFDKTIEK